MGELNELITSPMKMWRVFWKRISWVLIRHKGWGQSTWLGAVGGVWVLRSANRHPAKWNYSVITLVRSLGFRVNVIKQKELFAELPVVVFLTSCRLKKSVLWTMLSILFKYWCSFNCPTRTPHCKVILWWEKTIYKFVYDHCHIKKKGWNPGLWEQR